MLDISVTKIELLPVVNVRFVVVPKSQIVPLLDRVQLPEPIVNVLMFVLLELNPPNATSFPLALNVPETRLPDPVVLKLS